MKVNLVAGALSCVSTINSSTATNDVLAKAETSDTELQQQVRGGSLLKLQEPPLPWSETTVYRDISAGWPRPYVPSLHRRGVLKYLHDLSHPGIHTSTHLMADCHVWPCMQCDCRTWTTDSNLHSVPTCQNTRHIISPLGAFSQPLYRCQHVHLYVIGPFLPAGAYCYCLTSIDSSREA